MIRMIQSTTNVWNNERTFLNLVVGLSLAIPIAYGAYLMLDTMMLQTDIATLLQDNTVEAINLLVNLSVVYVAYGIYQYNKSVRRKVSYIAFSLLFIAQICFLNLVGVLLFIIYIVRFIGFKHLLQAYANAETGRNLKLLLPAMFVCFVAVITLYLRFQLGFLF